MSLKDDKISFSDQISSRLQRWVQRTTSKVRNEKERSQNVRVSHEEHKDIKGTEIDIKKCTSREDFARRSRESRSYEELEKALTDLINNCVTSSSVTEEGSLITHNTNINITRENNNTESVPTTKTNNDIETGFDDQFRASKNLNDIEVFETSSGGDDLKERENSSRRSVKSDQPKTQSDEKSGQCNIDEENGETTLKSSVRDVSLVLYEENKEISSEGRKRNKDLDNFSKPFDSCEINSSFDIVNKGLNNSIDKSSFKELNSKNGARTLKQKPPLRRIQSEGDALELKLCFKDSDVTEFAATCVRHAQQKRLSDTTPVDGAGVLSKTNEVIDSVEHDSVFAPNGKETTNKSKHIDPIPEITLDQTDNKDGFSKTEHIPLSDRPSSLSFPLESPKRKSKASSIENFISKHSPSRLSRSVPIPPRSVPIPKRSGPSTSQPNPSPLLSSPSPSLSSPSPSWSTPSPKYRRFPCQPVFYVPKPSDTRSSPNSSRSGSIGEPSKEYLI